MVPAKGSVLAGRYVLLGEIGSGGMGTVYRARDARVGRVVAVKILHRHLAQDPAYVERFRREAQIALTLDSPHVVQVLDFGHEGESHFLVMEYVEGTSLRNLLRRRDALPEPEALSIAIQVARALEEAHGKNVTHRDIKPENIMVAQDGTVKVADFGVAKAQDYSTLTITGALLGTVQYMAPEFLRGQSGPASDIYSLGVVLYQMLAGVVPFEAETPWHVMQMHVEVEPPSLAEHGSVVSPEVERVVMRCLAKEPADRYPGASELRQELEGLLQGMASDLLARWGPPAPVDRESVGGVRRSVASALGLGAKPLMALATAWRAAVEPAPTPPEAPEVEAPEPAAPTSVDGAGMPPPRQPRLTALASLPRPYWFAALGALATVVIISAVIAGLDKFGGGDRRLVIPPTAELTRITMPGATLNPVLTPPSTSISTPAAPAAPAPKDAIGGGPGTAVAAQPSPQQPTLVPPSKTTLPLGDYLPIGKIAFVSSRDGNQEIYVMNGDGSAVTRLTNNPASDTSPAWSPDGGRIAFVSSRDGCNDIYVMNADGTGATRLTYDCRGNHDPAWSPDGSKIAFTSGRDGNAEIYVMNADGSGAIRLTYDPEGDYEPAWSPDGSRIAFRSNRSGGTQIYVMNADGSGVTRLTYTGGPNWSPAWSPDGSRLAFAGPPCAVSFMNADGSSLVRVMECACGGLPTWSPDGSRVAFASARDGNCEIYIMKPDGTDARRLTDNLAVDYDPAWSPMRPPTENLVPNASFEEGTVFPSGWEVSGAGSQAVIGWDGQIAHDGQRSIRWTFAPFWRPELDGCAVTVAAVLSSPIPVVPSTTYTLAVWARSSSSVGWVTELTFGLELIDHTGASIGRMPFAWGVPPAEAQWNSASTTIGPGAAQEWPSNVAAVRIKMSNGFSESGGGDCNARPLSLWADDVFFGAVSTGE